MVRKTGFVISIWVFCGGLALSTLAQSHLSTTLTGKVLLPADLPPAAESPAGEAVESAPEAGVQVKISSDLWASPRITETNQQGRFFLSNLKPGTYTLQAYREPFRSSAMPVTLVFGKIAEVDLELEPSVGEEGETWHLLPSAFADSTSGWDQDLERYYREAFYGEALEREAAGLEAAGDRGPDGGGSAGSGGKPIR